MLVGTKARRENAKERTGLIFSGMGLGDVAAGALIFELAEKKGVGRNLPL
jgi:ornithine cyclodeaminase/alanine dehydrogenase-like protein (mu-crystallin family)